MSHEARRALASTAFFLAVALTATSARASDSCVQTRVTESFVSPDGRVRGPGMVKICPHWEISPSLRLSRVLFNGQTLGIWMTRAGEGGRFAQDGSVVAFRRLPERRIALADYYWPGRDGRPWAPGLRAAEIPEPSTPTVSAPAASSSVRGQP